LVGVCMLTLRVEGERPSSNGCAQFANPIWLRYGRRPRAATHAGSMVRAPEGSVSATLKPPA